MPPATITQAPGQSKGATPAPALPPTPFIRASFEHTEQFSDYSASTNQTAAVAVTGGPIDIPAYGYLRSLVIRVDATGGTGVAAVYTADAPWSIISELQVLDTNSAPIVGPISGYTLFLINKYGGYSGHHGDPTTAANYVAPATTGNFSFTLRVPLEISRRDGMGSLANQSQAQPYKLRLIQAVATDVYSTPPTTYPTVRFRIAGEFWAPSDPTAAIDGRPVATRPPADGTSQMWSSTQVALNSGQQNVKIGRVGHVIRQFLLVWRVSGSRVTASMPDPLSLVYDGKQMWTADQNLLLQYMIERNFSAGQGASNLDAGVFQISFAHDFDGTVGDEMRDLWLRTAPSTRLELQGNWTASGSLQIITNDIAPQGAFYLD